MNINSTCIQILAISAGLCLPAAPMFAQTGASPSQATTSMSQTSAAEAEAQRMVPATVVLSGGIDAKKMQPGASFQAKLDGKIHLANGTELPSGTVFEGTVANDDMNLKGNSKLALRFTKADLKDGTSIPIKATIVAVNSPQSASSDSSSYEDAGVNSPNTWSDRTLVIDQIGVLSGVDLHSRVAGANSGVLVTTTKDDVKLAKGSSFGLAVAQGKANQKNIS